MTLESTTDVRGGCSVQRFVRVMSLRLSYLSDSESIELPDADALEERPALRPRIQIEWMLHGGKGRMETHTRTAGDGMEREAFRACQMAEISNRHPVGANHYASRLPDSPAWYVWDKRDGVGENNLADCELAWCNVGGSARLKRHLWMGLCRDSEIGSHLHPTQKPVVVMAWAMDKAKIPQGATVLDPYMGSGSTGIACLRTGRNFIGVERDAAHYKTACDRFAQECDGALL